jgi:hypothetical protein
VKKLRPVADKRDMNEAFALKHGRKTKKSTKRKLRHERVVVRETARLIAMGIDPTQSEAPIA